LKFYMLQSRTISKLLYRIDTMAKRVTVYKGSDAIEVWEDKVENLLKKGWATDKAKPKAEVKAKTPKPKATQTNEA
jgi:hypothetical protein